MSAPLLHRKVHRWASLAVAVPLLIMISTGILLHLKKDINWLQPATHKGSAGPPSLSFEGVLAAARRAPGSGIRTWEDVDRVDVRPGKGLIKVRGKNRMEVQLDAGTGEVLQVAYRRSDIIEHLHDGSWFHPWIKRGVFLPVGLLLLALWMTGFYLILLPYQTRRKRRKR